ncbi:hypothetical protein BaRGS_00025210 [Batillaria attramentaria]|uniref:Uncharacterized protein n=1 Tax=Batillaria attramentaria TaxID=370345 RepID=A0ABD0K8V4_9CAEN
MDAFFVKLKRVLREAETLLDLRRLYDFRVLTADSFSPARFQEVVDVSSVLCRVGLRWIQAFNHVITGLITLCDNTAICFYKRQWCEQGDCFTEVSVDADGRTSISSLNQNEMLTEHKSAEMNCIKWPPSKTSPLQPPPLPYTALMSRRTESVTQLMRYPDSGAATALDLI